MIIELKKGATKLELAKINKQLKTIKGVDTKKFCGVIDLKENPLQIQKKMRNEWE
jgi:hypothetical protein